MEKKKYDECDRSIFSLTMSIPYQIRIAGQLGQNWPDWLGIMDVQTEIDHPGFPTTVLTGSLDQAALIGLLRRLYSLGFPLISVNCFKTGEQDN